MNKWAHALVIAAGIFACFSLYLFLRRGFYNLYITNKVFSSTAAVLAGLTLLVGPLARQFPIFLSFVSIRRHIGLLAFASALVHTTISLFFLTAKFPVSWYLDEWIPIGFGFLAIGFWVYVASISNNASIKRMGRTWTRHQQLFGYLAFLAIFLHLGFMKYQGWIKWLNGQVKATPELANPNYPPASMFVFLIMSTIIVYRIILVFSSKKGDTQKRKVR